MMVLVAVARERADGLLLRRKRTLGLVVPEETLQRVPGYISRSASLSEKELKEAKARSQRIAAQLTTPPSSNSKGVLLFHRRKQRVNAFTLEAPKTTSGEQAGAEGSPRAIRNSHCSPSHGKESLLKQTLIENIAVKASSCTKNSGLRGQKSGMEKYEESLAVEQTLDNTQEPQRNKIKSEEAFATMNTSLSSEEIPAEDFQQLPLSVYLKQSTGTASTNGLHGLISNEFEKAPLTEQAPVADNTENLLPVIDYVPVTDRENNSTILEQRSYILRKDREKRVLDKEPYLPITDSENNNNNIRDKELYAPVIDTENNIVLDKTMSDPNFDRKENGEILSKELEVPIIEDKNVFPAAETERPILAADMQPSATMTHNNKQYCEVRLTLSKPLPVKNRTARPFGTRSLATTQTPAEKSPMTEFPPPPTYAETFSSPPPVTRVRSPPAYSALYPSEEQKAPVLPGAKNVGSRAGALSAENRESPPAKTGILEESVARRAAKKSMFTFVEKPKVAPNPDLLNLVQTADNRKKQKGQGAATPEEEPFALGAEASNFLPESRPIGGSAQAPADTAPEWSSCLRSPKIQPKPMIKSNHSLSEARGKGAELFARRQSRMQKYVIESPSHPDITRSPSPTMSLPPSWKYASETHLSPMTFQPAPKSPVRSPKAPPVPLYNNNISESEISRKEMEISKQQPYQLQSSLFILSPAKDPVRSLPKGAPSPKPVVSEPSYMRQTSCPTSPLPPSPVLHPPAQFSSGRSFPGLFAPSAGTVLAPQNIRTHAEASLEPSFEYSSRILSPRAKGVFQAPRPSYSTKNAGIEPQERKMSLPASPTWTPRLLRRQPSSLDGWVSPAQTPEPEDGLMEAFRVASVMTPPPPPMSPSWSERSLSPFRQETDPKSSRQMQALLARNIINAAKRKSSSPKAVTIESFRPFTPPAASSGGSPKSMGNHSPSPLPSPRPTRVDGYRHVSLPVSTAPLQISVPSNNSPRLLGSQSPTYKSPLQSPKAARVNGNKYFTMPASTGASLYNAATSNNGPRTTGTHSVAHRDPLQSPKATILDSHRIFAPPATTTRKSSCICPKNLGTSSPVIKSPLPSPVVGAHSPVKCCASMSPTNSDVSLDSEDSGIKSPSIRSFNICPRGWNGSLRLKRGSLPAEAPCTS
ncbi:synaptopodin isoform X2 [Rhineura floridana]|uniref:synaptopodin isoform X2 n=1 Tax=Rhineura floridana TaxID=261503 RepID=UPI002AC7F360|nr:synaptopodin isoform X2 [Rhineura floridana]